MWNVKRSLVWMLLLSVLTGFHVTAQDDLDFDALFEDDVQEEASAPETTVDVEEAAPEMAPEEAADDPFAEFDELLDDSGEEMSADIPADAEPADPMDAPAEPMEEAGEDDFDLEALFDEGEDDPASDMEEIAEDIEAEADAEAPVVAEIESMEEEPVEEVVEEIDPEEAAKALSTAERVKRQAREVQGIQSLQEGYELLNQEQYNEALEAFRRAEANIPERKATLDSINRAIWGQIEANYRIAKRALKDGNLKEAERFANAALELDPVHRGAGRILAKVEKQKSIVPEEPLVKETQEYLDKIDSIEDLFDKGRQYFEAKDYDAAEIFFERILLEDPYHINSMRFLRKINERRYQAASKEMRATQIDMIQQVRDTWSPPIEGGVEIPGEVAGSQGPQVTISEAAQLEDRMDKIIIPKIEFRQANIQDVVNFLVEASIVQDPTGEGVNIILSLGTGGSGSAGTSDFSGGGGGGDPFAADDPFADPFASEPADTFAPSPASFGGGSDIPKITLNLRRVKLLDAIRFITEVADLKFRIQSSAVIITRSDAPVGRVITRVYPVLPSFLEVVVNRPDTDPSERDEFVELGTRNTEIGPRGSGVKEFFVDAGIPFPQGTSITYNPSISSLIVANTQENIELFERILPQFNVVPNQVEIEARFVEVSQTDLEELGFEWFFTDDVELASEKGIGPVATKERIQLDADAEGATKGIRFFNLGQAGIEPGSTGAGTALNPLGNILSLSSVLTNPEMTLIVNALDQNGNADVLSAPRVTTRSGVNAQMEVVDEIIYPTEFETDIGTLTTQLGEGGGTLEQTLVTITPGSFETREVGVILNVTPTVGPDGYTIELVLAPEVAELSDWIDYGTTTRIPQPIFSSRNVTTSIVIWDGQTVVMGGLISERLVTINDKIPLLGDIPLLGRLFQNKGESSEKRNLLIFVTARVVDPAGKPIRRAEPQSGAQTASSP